MVISNKLSSTLIGTRLLPVFVLAAAVVCHPALASTTVQVFNFDNNLLPQGWGELGGQHVRNQRIEFDAALGGNTFAPFNFDGVSKLSIEYDTNIVGPVSVSARVWAGSYGTYTNAGLEISGAPNNAYANVGAYSSTASVGYYNNLSLPYGSGAYHVSATYANGLVSYSAVDRVTGLANSAQNAPAPYLSLRSNMLLGLFGSAPQSGGHGWIDNLKITAETQAPKTYGLFIGVHDRGENLLSKDLRGDLMAQAVSDAFGSKAGVVSTFIPVDATGGGAIDKNAIDAAIQDIKSKMAPEDKFVLYINAHGGSIDQPNVGDGQEAVKLGKTSYLYDFELRNSLSILNGHSKTVFIDACHAGGFWGTNDAFEMHPLGLEVLGNVALFAAAAENTKMYYDELGKSFYSLALMDALSIGIEKFSAQELASYLEVNTRQRAAYYQNNQITVYEGAFGDAVVADVGLFKSIIAASNDFDVTSPVVSVPEPSEYALLVVGLGWLKLFFDRLSRMRARTVGGRLKGAVPGACGCA